MHRHYKFNVNKEKFAVNFIWHGCSNEVNGPEALSRLTL